MTHEQLMKKYRQEEKKAEERYENMSQEEREQVNRAARGLGSKMQSSVGGDVVEKRGEEEDYATPQS